MQGTVHDLVREARERGCTVFLSSHDLTEVARVCDRVGILGAGVWALVAVVGPAFGVVVGLGGLAVAILAVALLATGFGMLALLVAGFSGRRGLGAGVAAGFAVALYVLNVLGSAMAGLHGLASVISPFHWSGGPGVLINEVEWGGTAALCIVPVVLLVLTVLAYERRDLGA
jgi:energy-coupling factor transporter ATP-binding protein EcfA2